MSTIQLPKIIKILVLPNANYLHLDSNNCPPTYRARSLILSADDPSPDSFLSVSLPFPPNPNHQLKFSTIPNCLVRSFQDQFELSPFFHSLNLKSVSFQWHLSSLFLSTSKNRPLAHPSKHGVISGFSHQSNLHMADEFIFKDKIAKKQSPTPWSSPGGPP